MAAPSSKPAILGAQGKRRGGSKRKAHRKINTLLRVTADLASLVTAIQALALEREEETIFAHVLNLTGMTLKKVDRLYGGIAELQDSLFKQPSN